MNKLEISKKLGLTGVGLCVLCCSLPLIGMSAGVAAFTAIAYYLEKIGIVLTGGAAIFFIYHKLKSRKTSPSCRVDCSCKEQPLKGN